MSSDYIEVSATSFARQFPKMKEDVREYGIISVLSHNRSVGAFISPAVVAELEELRRRKRAFERLEDMDDGFFAALDQALDNYNENA